MVGIYSPTTKKLSILQMSKVSGHNLISILLNLHKREVNLTNNFHPFTHYKNYEIKNNK